MEYVEMKIGKETIITMVDSGATHNFMSEDTTWEIGIKFILVKE